MILHDYMNKSPRKKIESAIKNTRSTEKDAGALSVYLAEYEAQMAQILQVQSAQNLLVLYSLLTVGVAIPTMAGLLQNQIWVSLLILPMVFSSMAWAYTGYVGMSYRHSIYINAHLRPAINSLLRKESQNFDDVILWEEFARSKGLNVLALPKGFEILLFILPSIGSIALYFGFRNSLGFEVKLVDWILLAIDIFLTVGALVMAVVVTRVGYSRLSK